MKTKLIKLLAFIFIGFSTTLSALEKATQTGIGTVDIYKSHGVDLYRFVPKAPNEKKLRLVKIHVRRMGYKGGKLPEKMEAFFAKALAEKSEIELTCKFLDKGAGKSTSIGIEVISYKFVK